MEIKQKGGTMIMQKMNGLYEKVRIGLMMGIAALTIGCAKPVYEKVAYEQVCGQVTGVQLTKEGDSRCRDYGLVEVVLHTASEPSKLIELQCECEEDCDWLIKRANEIKERNGTFCVDKRTIKIQEKVGGPVKEDVFYCLGLCR